MTFDTLAEDLHTVLVELNLRDVTLVGFSLGTGELARYVGSHGTERVRACVFIETLAPSFAKSAENPTGADQAVVASVQQAISADRFQWLTGLLGDLFNLDENLGHRISEETVRTIYYPVTDAAMDTASYDEFAEGYYLTRKAMEWFWDAYIPIPTSGRRSLRRPTKPQSSSSRGCRRPGCSSTRLMCCATRARPTRPNCAWPASHHHRALRRRRARLHAPQRDE